MRIHQCFWGARPKFVWSRYYTHFAPPKSLAHSHEGMKRNIDPMCLQSEAHIDRDDNEESDQSGSDAQSDLRQPTHCTVS